MMRRILVIGVISVLVGGLTSAWGNDKFEARAMRIKQEQRDAKIADEGYGPLELFKEKAADESYFYQNMSACAGKCLRAYNMAITDCDQNTDCTAKAATRLKTCKGNCQ